MKTPTYRIGISMLTMLLFTGGCAQLQKELNRNMVPSHPLESRFSHVVFSTTQLPYPALRTAGKAITKNATRRASEAERRVGPKTNAVKAKTKVRKPKANVALPNAYPKADLGLEEVEAPDIPQVVPKKQLGDGSIQSEILAAAQRLVGIQSDTFKGGGFLMHLLQVTDYSLEESDEPVVKALYQELNRNELVASADATPTAGDLVFFHNTYDRDGDGRADDWFTQAGVVERVDGNGTVHFISYSRGQIRRLVLNTIHPARQSGATSGQEFNSFMREKTLSDRPFTTYLAGELFAAYGTLKE